MKKENKIEQLICNTLVDMMENKPYYSIKVTDIVQQAGISRSSFYVYFDSIYEVLQKIEDNFLNSLPDEKETTKVALSRASRNDSKLGKRELNTYQYIMDNMRIYRILSGPNGEPSFHIRMRNRISRVTSSVISEELHCISDVNKQIIATFFAGGKMAVSDWWAYHANNISVEEMAEITVDLYTKLFNFVLKTEKRNESIEMPSDTLSKPRTD
jgi:Transcriptional regulator